MTKTKQAFNVLSFLRRSELRTVLVTLLFALAFLSNLQYSAIDSSNNIDGSWHFTLTGLLHSGQTLGKDVYFSYGPLFERGFTYVNPSSNFKDFLASDLFVVTTLGLLVFALVIFIRLWRKELKKFPLILVSICILLSISQFDTLFYISAAFCVLALLKEKRLWARLLILAGIDLFSLYKFSFSLTLIVLCLFVFFEGFSKSALRKMVINWTTFIVLFWLIYSLLIQNPSPIYLIRYLHFGAMEALYYSEFMSLPLSLNYIVIFVFIAFAVIGGIGAFAYLYENQYIFKKPYSIEKYRRILPILVVALSSFVLFKEAVVRTDSHVVMFPPVLFIWCGLLMFYLNNTKWKIIQGYKWLGAVSFVFVAVLYFWTLHDVLGNGPWMQLTQNIKVYANSIVDNRLNYGYFKTVRAESQESFNKRSHELDTLLSQPNNIPPKGATIIDWGNTTLLGEILTEKGYHVLYEPFLQNYEAHPPTLFDPVYINFLRAHPSAYVFEEETEGSVSQYLPTYQLNNYFEYIAHNYKVVARNDNLRQYILKRVSSRTETCNSYTEATSDTGDLFAVPQPSLKNNQYLKMNVNFSGTLPDSVLGLVVKQPTYDMQIYNQDNGMMIWRVNKTILEHGVVVDPLYLNFHDYVNNVPFQLKHMVINGDINRHGSIQIKYELCTFKK